MQRRLALSLVALIAAIVLFVLLSQQNKAASDDNSAFSYLSFNRAGTKEAQSIMDFWRKDPKRTAAVKEIVVLDYILIALYVVYLCFSLWHRRKVELGAQRRRRWLIFWLGLGILFIGAGAVIDGIQDGIIYAFADTDGPVRSLRTYTTIKWLLIFFGALPLVISLTTLRKIDYLSGFLKTVWTFFPSLVFIFLTILAFWVQGQGKDIILAFTETKRGFNQNLLFFFLAVGFWVYVTWYSSRIISYIKEEKGGIFGNYLDSYPRIAGNACFLVLELAILQSPLLATPLLSVIAWPVFILALVGLHFVDKWIRGRLPKDSKPISNRYWMVFALYLVILLIVCVSPFASSWQALLFLLLLLHGIYLVYINLHHFATKGVGEQARSRSAYAHQPKPAGGLTGWIMSFFYIHRDETGFFKWFIRLGVVAIVIDLLAIWSLPVARGMGPFPLLITAFAVLLAFLSLVTAFSVKYTVNFHLIFFLIVFFFGLSETHKVRTPDLKNSYNNYTHRPALEFYLRGWLKRLPHDTSSYDAYFILANGGASRSGYWTASVLGTLEDTTIGTSKGRFSDHLFCLSGTSGGGVGVAAFYALLNDKTNLPHTGYRASAAAFLQQDYFSHTAARLLGPDYFNYIFRLQGEDRGAVLEEAFEKYKPADGNYDPHFDRPFSQFPPMTGDSSVLPALFVNTTRMQDGNPGLVTNLKVDTTFNTRIDVLGLLDSTTDISMASGSILGARFPYLSPAGRINTNYFVDGGYFDNSGAGVVQELLRGIINIGRDHPELDSQIRRLHFRVVHILNSPIIPDSSNQKPVAPIKNDLFAPILTIVGAYDMQTTVNDGRLKSYVADIRKYYHIEAEYREISLYKKTAEWLNDPEYAPNKKERPYSMNWFMSDSTRRRIDKRLSGNTALDSIITIVK